MERCCFFLAILAGVCSFNVDVQDKTIVEFSGTNSSHFGYSVGLRTTTVDEKVVVGAPLYKTSDGKKAGQMHSCDISTGTCKVISYDGASDSAKEKSGRAEESLGMSITAINETVMVTAPRWVDSQFSEYYRGRAYTFHNSGLQHWYNLIPCGNERYGNLYYGYCLAGMSSSGVTHNGYPLYVVGAPGSVNSQGVLFSFSKRESSTYVYRTNGDRLGDDVLMGYSVSAGRISDASKVSGYMADMVGGAPRASGLQGKVIVYTLTSNGRMVIAANIESPHDQIGSYFGASVCVVDVNNDGKDDLLVGSPKFYFDGGEDEGVVYVYLNRKGQTGFDRNKEPLVGEKMSKAQFGTSITNIGDINKDGYNDVAIGAPYAGPGDKGAVYIYSGGKTGIVITGNGYSQVIYGNDMPNGGAGFGISVSGQVDVDGNKYPDLIVGAYKDSKAYVLKTKPVIKLRSALRTSVDAVPTTTSNTYRCTTGFSFPERYNCIELYVDLTYFGDSTPSTLDFDITVDCDNKKPAGKRAFTSDKVTQKTERVTLTSGIQSTVNFSVGVLIDVDTDVISPITFTASYKENIDRSACGTTPCPILDQFSKKSDSHEITYLKECASESICKPDLVVSGNLTLPDNQTKIIYGRVYEVDVFAKVENYGEAAYQSLMKMNFSSDLAVDSVVVNQKPYPLWDAVDVTSSIKQLAFPLGNPIAVNKSVEVVVKFSVYKPRPSSSSYTFSMEASAFGDDTNKLNNNVSVSIETKIEYCVAVASDAKPALIQYKPVLSAPPVPSKNNTLNDSVLVDVIGSEVNYTFYVQNSGRLPVEKLKATIEVVVEKSQLDFIYVVHLEVGGVECPNNDLNNLNYKLPFVDYQNQPRAAKDLESGVTSCRSASCKTYSCEIGQIAPSKGVIITMVTRLWDHNLAQIRAGSVEMGLKVELVGQNSDWYIQKPGCDKTSTVTLELSQSEEKREESVEWWIIVLAIVGAIILLAVAIAVLYKLGFFTRKRTAKNITGPNETGNHASNPNADDDDDDDE